MLNWLRQRKRQRRIHYGAVLKCYTQGEASAHVKTGGIGLVMLANGKPKTAVIMCPSGCGELLRINLLSESGRAWICRIDRHGRLSLVPSVNRESGCMAHFVFRENVAHLWA